MNSQYLYISKIVHSTSADGVGLRNSLYVSGCPLRCEGCHNSALWDLSSGTKTLVQEVCNALNVDGFNISILGGEPLMQYDAILELCKLIKTRYPKKTIWMWSGYTIEHIKNQYPLILEYIDVLVDGPFVKEEYEPNLQWKGSKNQRIINVKDELIQYRTMI